MNNLQPIVEEPYSKVLFDEDIPCGTFTALKEEFEEQYEHMDCYKVSITFNRKIWRKARAFNYSFQCLRRYLDTADVEKGIFFMEQHQTGFPHIHGILKWESEHYETNDWLRSTLVQVYGQTKMFKYDPVGFRKKCEEEKRTPDYNNWFEYMSKDFSKMKDYQEKVKVVFPIIMMYERVKEDGKYRYKQSQFR